MRKGRAEVTFNELLEAVAEKLIQILGTSAMSSAKAAVGTTTTAISPLLLGTVTLKHKIKGGNSFDTAIIERYCHRASKMEETL